MKFKFDKKLFIPTKYAWLVILSILILFFDRVYLYGIIDGWHNSLEWRDPQQLLLLLGAVAGVYISSTIFSYIVEQKKFRVLFVFAVVCAVVYLLSQNKQIWHFYNYGFDYVIDSWVVSTLLQGILPGLIWGFVGYAALYFLKTPVPFLVLFYSSAYSGNSSPKGLLNFGISFGILLVVSLIFYFNRFSLPKHSIKTKQFVFLLVLIIISFIVAYGGSVSVHRAIEAKQEKIDTETRKQLDKEMERRRAQEEQEVPAEKPVGGMKLSADIVGMYQADKPLYLKFALFDINQQENRLKITPVNHNTSGSDYFVSNNMVDDQPDKSAKVVFARFPKQALLSPERTSPNNGNSNKQFDGLLVSRINLNEGEEFIERYKFLYRPYEEGLSQNVVPYSSYDYVSISENSERYDEIVQLAREITKDANTDLEKARAVEKYFHDNYEYSLNPNFKDKVNPMDDFILDMKKGYCLQYAVATSFLLDIVNVRSRLVGGYYSSYKPENFDGYVILASQAHAWNEVYDTTHGWVTIDSTPSSGTLEGGSGGVPISEMEKAEVELRLKAVDPKVSFDDVFDPRRAGENGQSNDPARELLPTGQAPNQMTEKTEEQIKREKEAAEQLEKQKELEKKQQEEREKIAKGIEKWGKVVAAVIGLLSVCIVGVYMFFNRDYLRERAAQLRVRAKELAVRKLFMKQYHLSPEYETTSSKKFMQAIPKTDQQYAQLREFFHLSYKIQYGKYSKADFAKCVSHVFTR